MCSLLGGTMNLCFVVVMGNSCDLVGSGEGCGTGCVDLVGGDNGGGYVWWF